MSIPARLRRQVVDRADNRCEYCGLSQAAQEATFHVDHVTPRVAGGQTILANLALACVSCSLRKGATETGIDPQTGREANLFNPRRDSWRVHFRWNQFRVVGLSATGRATVEGLGMNRPLAQAIRAEELHLRRHPPPRHL